MAIPNGFPRALEGPMAWLPSHVKEENYLYEFSQSEIDELDRALMNFKGLPQHRDRL
jgi:hypothetical protein